MSCDSVSPVSHELPQTIAFASQTQTAQDKSITLCLEVLVVQ
jgi:hypothetical protein